jgi:Protein of unknown function (DUF3489)
MAKNSGQRRTAFGRKNAGDDAVRTVAPIKARRGSKPDRSVAERLRADPKGAAKSASVANIGRKAAETVRRVPSGKRQKPNTPGGNGVGPTKLAQITQMLRGSGGACLCDLMRATGWQAHSVRGALSGSLKKKRGLAVTSARVDGDRRYRIEG